MASRAPRPSSRARRSAAPSAPTERSRSTSLPLRAVAVLLIVLGIVPGLALWISGSENQWGASFVVWMFGGPILLIVAAVGVASLASDGVDTGLAILSANAMRPSGRAVAATLGIVTAGMAAVFSLYAFHGRPWLDDENSQLFQAHLLTLQRLWAHTPPFPEFFDTNQTITRGGKWFSEFPIGGPLLLSLGTAMGMPWLVNPLLAGWTTVNVYRFASHTVDQATARIAGIIFATSPFVLLLAATQMNHTAALAFGTWALASVVEWGQAPDGRTAAWPAVRVGAGLAAAAATRPYDAALLGLVIAAAQIGILRRRRDLWGSVGWQILGGVPALACLLLANAATTGSPLYFGYDLLNGPGHRPGFHVDPYGHPFTPALGLINTVFYLLRTNVALLEWPIPCLALVAAGMAVVRRPTRWDYLMAGTIVAIVGGYAAYWSKGDVLGPRFYALAMPAFAISIARAIRETLRAKWRAVRRVGAVAVTLAWLVAWMPASSSRFAGVWARVGEDRREAAAGRSDVLRRVRDAHLGRSLVFVPESWRGRMAARLRALGEPALLAETAAADLDACALDGALDASDTLRAETGTTRLRWVLDRAAAAGSATPLPGRYAGHSLSLIGGIPSTAACADRLRLDDAPAIALDELAPDDALTRDGRFGDGPVFARDLGPRDSLLAKSFGDRPWYRYVSDANGIGRIVPFADTNRGH